MVPTGSGPLKVMMARWSGSVTFTLFANGPRPVGRFRRSSRSTLIAVALDSRGSSLFHESHLAVVDGQVRLTGISELIGRTLERDGMMQFLVRFDQYD